MKDSFSGGMIFLSGILVGAALVLLLILGVLSLVFYS